MRRTLSLAVLVVGLSALVASPASALVGFGVHAGFDLNSQDAKDLAGDLGGGDTFTLEREKITAPLMGGVHLIVTAAPIVDVEFGVEGSLRKYHLLYTIPDAGVDVDDDVYFGRISAYASAKVNIVNLPLVKGYGGAGLGYHIISPLMSRELLKQKVVDENQTGDALDPSEVLSKEGSVGAHLLAGLRFKPAFLPLGLSVETRYTFLPENDYGDETNRFASVVFGLDLGF